MPDFFTPLTDGEMGRSEAVNSRFREAQAAVAANAGVLVARTPWTTLADTAPSITINVMAGDNTLQLMATLRTDRAAQQIDSVLMTINDDISSTYTVRYGYYDGGALFSKVEASGTSGFEIGAAAAGAIATAGQYSFLKVMIPLASSASPKYCTIDSICDAEYPAFAQGGGYYPGASTIIRLKLFPRFGTVFTAGCRYALFGMA